MFFFFFSSRRRHTRLTCDWSSDVCSSDLIAAPADDFTFLGERGLLVDLGGGRMQIVDVPRDHRALGIAPWSLADAIARVDAGIAARQRGAEIGAPIRG